MENYKQVINDAVELGTLLAVGYLALKDEQLSRDQMRELATLIMEKKVLLEIKVTL